MVSILSTSVSRTISALETPGLNTKNQKGTHGFHQMVKPTNQIDYILIHKRFRNSVINCKSIPGADGNSNHNPVIANIRLKLKRMSNRITKNKWDMSLLKQQGIREY